MWRSRIASAPPTGSPPVIGRLTSRETGHRLTLRNKRGLLETPSKDRQLRVAKGGCVGVKGGCAGVKGGYVGVKGRCAGMKGGCASWAPGPLRGRLCIL
eukprot:1183379-Prorocentrum_minimum.AAC.2